MPLGLELIEERGTKLYVPSESLTRVQPATFPVFFNPAARTNRDISVAISSATSPATYLDALAATGARGLRVAEESSESVLVTLLDFSVPSLRVARMNVRKNRLAGRCEVVHEEANRFLASRFERAEKFDAVDVDPFGSPAPFVLSAVTATADGGILSLTATDAAVLCGVYPSVCRRRYGAPAWGSDYVHETGLRVLLGFAARMGGINDIGIEPVAVHSTLHYLRAYFRVRRGAREADRSVASLGYVTQCQVCGSRSSGGSPLERCQECARRVRSAGPLWTGPLVDEGVVRRAASFSERRGWSEAATTLAALRGIDSYPPYSYSTARVCSRLKVPSVAPPRVMDALASAGFSAATQPFEESGIKTDANYAEFASALRTASLSPP